MTSIPCGNLSCWVGRAWPLVDQSSYRCVCGWEMDHEAVMQRYAPVKSAPWLPTVPHPLVEHDRAAVRDWGDND